MNGAGSQALGEAIEPDRFAAEHDFANGGVIRQHADDDLAVEEIGDVRCGLEAKRRELALLLRTADISDHPAPGGSEVGGHCRAHLTKTDKTDLSLRRRVVVRSGPAPSLAGCDLGRLRDVEARIGLVLGHRMAPYRSPTQRPP